jgi:predicted transcriptional regulator
MLHKSSSRKSSTTYQKYYRDRLEIIENILICAGNGSRKTRIMYGANLSTVQLKRYLEMLVKIGCLAKDVDTQLYRITTKGRDMLEAIYEVSQAKDNLRRSQEKLEFFMPTHPLIKDEFEKKLNPINAEWFSENGLAKHKLINKINDIER